MFKLKQKWYLLVQEASEGRYSSVSSDGSDTEALLKEIIDEEIEKKFLHYTTN